MNISEKKEKMCMRWCMCVCVCGARESKVNRKHIIYYEGLGRKTVELSLFNARFWCKGGSLPCVSSLLSRKFEVDPKKIIADFAWKKPKHLQSATLFDLHLYMLVRCSYYTQAHSSPKREYYQPSIIHQKIMSDNNNIIHSLIQSQTICSIPFSLYIYIYV